jgi:molecular chaperone DnaK (HSP70)
MAKAIGIDLGTTNSCVAVMEGQQATARVLASPAASPGWAHIGGFGAGLLLGPLLTRPEQRLCMDFGMASEKPEVYHVTRYASMPRGRERYVSRTARAG